MNVCCNSKIMKLKVEYLVVDTTAFLNNKQLKDTGVNVVTVPEVIEEVKCHKQLRRLVVLPYDLKVMEPDPDCVSFITSFSKKTGDYLYLSHTDLKLIALTYQLEKEHVGVHHLQTQPLVDNRVEQYSSKISENIQGFYNPKQEMNGTSVNNDDSDVNDHEVPDVDISFGHISDDASSDQEIKNKEDNIQENETVRELCHDNDGDDDQEDDEDVDDEEVDDQNHSEELDPCVTDGDDAGWITPNDSLSSSGFDNTEKEVKLVACITSDFSMQNVLKHIGLNIVSMDGRLITEIRTFLLRCYGCFHVTPQTSRTFCPKCGNKTLKRVSVNVDSEGIRHVEINFKRPLTARGKRFPLPRPKGGKHAVNPVLCEDQRVPQQRLSKQALSKNNPLHPDYIAGVSPFLMHDVSSRSVILHGTKKTEIKYWLRKNPNEVIKRRRKK